MALRHIVFGMLLVLNGCQVLADDVDSVTEDPQVLACAADLSRGQLIQGARKYLNLHSSFKQEAALKKAYNGQNIDTLLVFTEELPVLSLRLHSIKSLIKVINDRAVSLPDFLLVLSYINNKYELVAIDQPTHTMLNQIKELLLGEESRVVDSWVNQVKSEDYNQVVNFADKHVDVFRNYVEKIVKLAYDPNDETSSLSLLKYSNALRKIEQSVDTITALNRLIGGRMSFTCALQMALEIGILQRMENFKNIPDDKKNALEGVMEAFPESVRGIGRENAMCFRNSDHFGMLYVPHHHDVDRDVVSTSVQLPNSHLSKKWRFVKEREWYLIKSVPNDDYLYAAGDHFAYDNSRRQLFTWRPGSPVSQGRWQLQEHNWRNNEYYVHNVWHNEFLASDDSESFKPTGLLNAAVALFGQKEIPKVFEKRAFTWRNHERGDRSLWKISICED